MPAKIKKQEEKLAYAYYPGCAAKQIQKEADWSTRAIADILDFELHEMLGASCCGAGNLQEHDPAAALAINARIFSQAEEMGMDILTICNTCLQTFSYANHRLKEDPELRENINKVLIKAGVRPYEGTIDIKHLIWALVDDIGIETVKEAVKNPLNGLKVAPFYGCHAMRPREVLDGRGGEVPDYLNELISAIGGKDVNYDGKDKCCGFHTMLVQEKTFLKMSGSHSLEAKREGAEVMVSPCTLCDMSLGAYQAKAEKELGQKIDLPEMNIAQLIAVSFGCDASEIGLYKLHQDPRKTFQNRGIRVEIK